MVIPKNFYWILWFVFYIIDVYVWSSGIAFLITDISIVWNIWGFAIISFVWSQSISIFDSSERIFITESILVEKVDKVLSSVTLSWWKETNHSEKYEIAWFLILNIVGKPDINSKKLLYLLLMWTVLYFSNMSKLLWVLPCLTPYAHSFEIKRPWGVESKSWRGPLTLPPLFCFD